MTPLIRDGAGILVGNLITTAVVQFGQFGKFRPLTLSGFQVHGVGHDVLQLHQFQLDRICATESDGRRRGALVADGDDDVGRRRRRTRARSRGTRSAAVAILVARG